MYRKIRNLALSAVIVITLYLLLQSFNLAPHALETRTRQSLRAISHFTPDSWRSSHAPRITKVTSLFGEDNELYEAAIRSHEEHDRLNGYEMKVFREKMVDSYWAMPTLLLASVVGELAKEEDERTEWIMWFGPDVYLLNPHIPLSIFLPPSDFPQAHFLGTQDSDGLNSGVFFLRVHTWSVKMLIDVLSIPPNTFPDSASKNSKALEQVLRSDAYRSHVFYQPRKWYNAYPLNLTSFEGEPGSLLVHFHGLSGGDKWSAMAETITQQSSDLGRKTWNVPLEQTSDESETEEYWTRIRTAQDLLRRAQGRMFEALVDAPFRRLQYASTYEVDDVRAMTGAIEGLREVVGEG